MHDVNQKIKPTEKEEKTWRGRQKQMPSEGEFGLATLCVRSSKLYKNSPRELEGKNSNWLHHSHHSDACSWGDGRWLQSIQLLSPLPFHPVADNQLVYLSCRPAHNYKGHIQQKHMVDLFLPRSHCSTHMWKWLARTNVYETRVRKQFTHLDIWLSMRLLQPIRAHRVSVREYVCANFHQCVC